MLPASPLAAVATAVGDGLAVTAFSGSLLLAVPVAMLAGLVSFASPCVLPLVPGYIGYVSGMAAASMNATAEAGGTGGALATRVKPARSRVVAGVALFVLGFTVVFVSFGAAFGGLGSYLVRWEDVITRVLGAVVILLGLGFLGAVPFLQREARFHVTPRAGLWGAPLLGIVFGLGWTPCIGPTLGAVQALAIDEASAGRGALLGVAYCIGLGVPFLLVALGLGSSERMMDFLRRHRLAALRIGGGMLVLVGLLLVTGLWTQLTGAMQLWIGGFETVI